MSLERLIAEIKSEKQILLKKMAEYRETTWVRDELIIDGYELGISQAEMARAMGIARRTVERAIEGARTAEPEEN